ncbi:hypothetical protein EOM86_11320, partial [Candidatus Nomurabacteria bacterium]|nr:hypothetical protein [Candidatus Nomurabacteria bacterium]
MNPYTFDFAAVYHTPDGVYAYPLDIDTLCIRIRTAKSDCLCVHIRFKDVYDHVILPERKRMELIRSDKYYDYYETEIRNKNKRFKYFFELTDRSGNVWDYSYSEFKEHDDEYNEFYFYPYLFAEEVPDPPEWVIGGMIYQIFIDRFRNGDISNDPADRLAWNELPSSKSFYGGDLKGITEKMEYIASLGANMIYVNPIFLSDSNHKYDTIDYYTIDPCFGSVEDACDMVRQAHRFGIRVILDAVFNHCSNKNSIFQDVVANGHNSDHYDWFSVDGNSIKISPHNYDTFAAQVPEIPQENYIVEPEMRGTASAIGLAAVHLAQRDPDATM